MHTVISHSGALNVEFIAHCTVSIARDIKSDSIPLHPQDIFERKLITQFRLADPAPGSLMALGATVSANFFFPNANFRTLGGVLPQLSPVSRCI